MPLELRTSRGARLAIGAALATVLALLLSWSASPSTAEARCKKVYAKADGTPPAKLRRAVKCQINKKRTAGNLDRHTRLQKAAQRHSRKMAKKGCFSHQCSGEPPLGERVGRTGYFSGASSYAYAETIARTGRNARPYDVVRMWMNSSSHRAILMSSTYEHIGVGVSLRGGSAYWTAVVGRRGG